MRRTASFPFPVHLSGSAAVLSHLQQLGAVLVLLESGYLTLRRPNFAAEAPFNLLFPHRVAQMTYISFFIPTDT